MTVSLAAVSLLDEAAVDDGADDGPPFDAALGDAALGDAARVDAALGSALVGSALLFCADEGAAAELDVDTDALTSPLVRACAVPPSLLQPASVIVRPVTAASSRADVTPRRCPAIARRAIGSPPRVWLHPAMLGSGVLAHPPASE
ncbi:MAG: hypothetical protein M3Y77_11145 [Actinomycetota bacterium]|nr:hypothetical protein [Actinomycetota bacterium]